MVVVFVCCIVKLNVFVLWFDVVFVIGDLIDFGYDDEYGNLCGLFVVFEILYYLMIGNYDDCVGLCCVFVDCVELQDGEFV